MHGNVTDEQWEMWRDAYTFFAAYCNPPPNQDDEAPVWWDKPNGEIGTLYAKWNRHPLIEKLLVATYEYINEVAKEKTEEMADFVQE